MQEINKSHIFENEKDNVFDRHYSKHVLSLTKGFDTLIHETSVLCELFKSLTYKAFITCTYTDVFN